MDRTIYLSFHLSWVLGPFVHGSLKTSADTYGHAITHLKCGARIPSESSSCPGFERRFSWLQASPSLLSHWPSQVVPVLAAEWPSRERITPQPYVINTCQWSIQYGVSFKWASSELMVLSCYKCNPRVSPISQTDGSPVSTVVADYNCRTNVIL